MPEYGLIDTDNPFDDFKNVFTMEYENSKEHLFSIQHQSAAAGTWGEPNSTRMVIAMNPRQENSNIWGWGWNYVYKAVGEPSYWETGDIRREVTIWGTGDDMAPVAPGDIFDMSKQPQAIVRPEHYAIRKFTWSHPGIAKIPSSPFNWPVLRYSDLLLIHAEASLLANGSLSGEGLASFNAVRDRAGLAPKTTVDIDDIILERQYELFAELHRWFDLMRKRIAEREFDKLTVNDKDGFNPLRNYKFPLPQGALDLNDKLEQNSAW